LLTSPTTAAVLSVVVSMSIKHEGIQLALPCTRIGRMGMLDLGHEYMAGVKARARMLAKATEVRRESNKKNKRIKE